LSIKYSDPFRDDKFGKLKGNKCLTWFKVYFNEGKLYKQDDGYILAANFTGFEGVSASFGTQGEQATSGLAVLPIYAKEYEERKSTGKQDDKGKWVYETVKVKPSIFEQWLCKQIEDNPSFWLPDGNQNISGNITFSLDPQVASMADDTRGSFFTTCYQISTVSKSDKLPEWKPKTPYRGANGYGAKGVSIEDKVAFLKKELVATIGGTLVAEDMSIGSLTGFLIDLHKDNEQFLVIYTDLIKAICAS
jgi:hypothetical protein